LTWFDRTGRVIGRVGALKDYRSIDLSPDGTRVVAHLHDESASGGSLWLFDLTRGTESRFTFTATHDGAARFSPDGTRIVFNSSESGRLSDLYLKETGGVATQQVPLKSDAAKSPRSWFTDGRLAGTTSTALCLSDIAILPLTGDRTRRCFWRRGERRSVSSPDGKLWYTSTSLTQRHLP
jgi:Tol biopolymer transport system component